MVAPHRPRPLLLAALLLTGLGALVAAGPQAQSVGITARDPIEQVNAELIRQGWRPSGDPAVETFARELSGNALSSLVDCAGTGAGFCRYDYARGQQRLEVITVPNRDGDGLVHHWQIVDAPAPGP